MTANIPGFSKTLTHARIAGRSLSSTESTEWPAICCPRSCLDVVTMLWDAKKSCSMKNCLRIKTNAQLSSSNATSARSSEPKAVKNNRCTTASPSCKTSLLSFKLKTSTWNRCTSLRGREALAQMAQVSPSARNSFTLQSWTNMLFTTSRDSNGLHSKSLIRKSLRARLW